MLNTVKVPEQFAPLFEKAQEQVGRYFREKKDDPSKGTIDIFGERYRSLFQSRPYNFMTPASKLSRPLLYLCS